MSAERTRRDGVPSLPPGAQGRADGPGRAGANPRAVLGDTWFRLRPIMAANVPGNVFRLDLDITAKGAKA
jgi:hypothetical protein